MEPRTRVAVCLDTPHRPGTHGRAVLPRRDTGVGIQVDRGDDGRGRVELEPVPLRETLSPAPFCEWSLRRRPWTVKVRRRGPRNPSSVEKVTYRTTWSLRGGPASPPPTSGSLRQNPSQRSGGVGAGTVGQSRRCRRARMRGGDGVPMSGPRPR